MKKHLGVIITLVTLFVALFCMGGINTQAASEGTCGTSVTWVLDDEGTLTISGTGKMTAYYTSSQVPWYSERSSIKKAVIEEGVTTLGGYLFYNTENLTEVSIPEGVTLIGEHAFQNATGIKELKLPSTLETIDDQAFRGMKNWKNVVIPEGVTTIGDWMFSASNKADAPESITLPSTLTEYGTSFINTGAATVIKGYTYSLAEVIAGSYSLTFESLGEAPLVTWAEGSVNDSITWTFDSRRTLTISGTGAIGSFSSSGYQPWKKYTGIVREVIIEEGIESIGKENFSDMTKLQIVKIPSTVKTIGVYAFENAAFKEVVIPDGVTTLDGSFQNCTKLLSITIPPSVTSISDDLLKGSTSASVKGYKYSEAEMYTKKNAIPFESIGEVEYAVLGEGSLSETMSWKLDNRRNLVITGQGEMPDYELETDIPWANLTKHIERIEISENITSIGQNMFFDCTYLTEVMLPSTLTKIGSCAFEACKSIERIDIPDGVTEIGSYAFTGCVLLSEADIPDGITEIDAGVFKGCVALKSAVIPEGVSVIGKEAFYDCAAAEGIKIPSGVTKIGAGAFYNCDKLTEAVIPEGVTEISDGVFEGCGTLATVTIEGDVTRIGDNAFKDTIITQFFMPESVTELGNGAFQNCKKLKELTFSENITAIPDDAFNSCIALSDFTVGKNVKSIGAKAFMGSGLKTLVINEGLETVGSSAFSDCESLVELTLPKSVTEIGSYAFNSCGKLLSVYIKGDCDILGHAFYQCPITDLRFEGKIGQIGGYAFNGANITSLNLLSGVDTLSNRAFYWCRNLTEVYFPDYVNRVEGYAFYQCGKLNKVSFGERVNFIDATAFDLCSSTLEIHGFENSMAELYAERFGYNFVSRGTLPVGEITSGSMNDNISWGLSSDGVLTLTGTGATEDYSYSWQGSLPWGDITGYVKHIVIGQGIEKVQDIGFDKHSKLESITLPYTVGTITKNALDGIKAGVEVKVYNNSLVQYRAEAAGKTIEKIGEAPDVVQLSGDFDENTHWSLSGKGVLAFEGEGDTVGYYDATKLPWADYVGFVKVVEIKDGIKNVNGWVAKSHTALTEINVAPEVSMIADSNYPDTATFKVKGYKYSIAEYFAGKKGYSFVSVGTLTDKVIVTGEIGSNASWSVTSRGKLIISGTGSSGSFKTSNCPWEYYNTYITDIVVEEGITLVGFSFASTHTNLKTVTLPSTIVRIATTFGSINKTATIKGYTNSVAETKANDASLTFVSLGALKEKVVDTGEHQGISYSITNTGKLKLWGEGALSDETTQPWLKYAEALYSVEICDGITETDGGFNPWDYDFKELILAPSVTEFDSNAVASDATIYGYTYSFAHDFATNHTKTFVSTGMAENAIRETGAVTDTITWTLDTHRNLVVEGVGEIPLSAYPWSKYEKLIETITVSDGITKIGGYVFQDCVNVRTITLGMDVEKIEHYAFEDCGEVECLTLGPKLKEISESYTFSDTKVKRIKGYTNSSAERLARILGATFESIGVLEECEVVLTGQLSETVFYSLDSFGVLTISGEGEIPDYNKTDSPWRLPNRYQINVGKIVIEDGITSIGMDAFEYLKAVDEVQFGADVEIIEEGAFRSTGFTELKLPKQIKTIYEGAFESCYNLVSVWLPEELETIPKGLFKYCYSLTHVEISKNVTTIEADAFSFTPLKYVYYQGTERNWTNYVTGKDNIPQSAEIFYSDSLTEEISVEVVGVSKTNKGASVRVKASLRGGEAVLAAGYDGEGALVDIIRIDAGGTFNLEGDIQKVKVFMWKSTYRMNPFDAFYEKEL